MKPSTIVVLSIVTYFILYYCYIRDPISHWLQAKEPKAADFKLQTYVTDEISFELEHCGCQRKLKNIVHASSAVSFNQTTCGVDAFRRGSKQKIISFAFYGDINSEKSKKKRYFQGILENLKLMPNYYPGWIMRLYYDLDKADPVFQDLCKVACDDVNIDICDAKNLPGTPFVDTNQVFPMNWRFFPTLDPQVDVFISRDLDSRFSDRELAA